MEMGQASGDEKTIRRIVAEMTEGFNRHDARAATCMYAANADFVSVRGEAAAGSGEIEEKLAAIFATRAGGAVLTTLDVKVRFVRPDVALVHVLNELSGLVAPDGEKLPSHRELSLRVFTRDGKTWRVAAFHNTMQRPFAAAVPPR
jgi:uncharacterized protein (TIGR02246 family)